MMRRGLLSLVLLLVLCTGCANPYKPEDPDLGDPWKGCNEGIYVFNDKLYFWVLKPVGQGWAFVIPEYGRERVQDFLFNLDTPHRLINTILQGNMKGSGIVLGRFVVNSTVGVLGLWDPAGHWGMQPQKEDFGQTFAIWRLAPGPYSVVPLFGPNTLRSTFGIIPDAATSPLTYLPGASLLQRINDTSLRLGEYQDFKDQALDPYVAMRNAWWQNRVYKIRNKDTETTEEGTAQ
jgi:phospholipid-binding lipoprotein MlaA